VNTIVITARSHCSAGCTKLEARLDKHRDLYVNALLTPCSCSTSDEEVASVSSQLLAPCQKPSVRTTCCMASALDCKPASSVAFIGTGNNPSTPRWPTIDGTERHTLLIPRSPSAENSPVARAPRSTRWPLES